MTVMPVPRERIHVGLHAGIYKHANARAKMWPNGSVCIWLSTLTAATWSCNPPRRLPHLLLPYLPTPHAKWDPAVLWATNATHGHILARGPQVRDAMTDRASPIVAYLGQRVRALSCEVRGDHYCNSLAIADVPSPLVMHENQYLI